jgi:hypothetical protein
LEGVGEITSLEAFDLSEFEIDVIAASIELVLDSSSVELVFKVTSDEAGGYTSSDADWAGNHAGDRSYLPDYISDTTDDFPNVDMTKGFAKKTEGFTSD